MIVMYPDPFGIHSFHGFFGGTRDGTFISHNLPIGVSYGGPITGSFTIPTACLRCLCLPCRGNESELQDKVEVYEPWYLGKQLVDSKTRHVLADSWKPKNAWHAKPAFILIFFCPQMDIIVLENNLSFLLLSSHNHLPSVQESEKHLFQRNWLDITMSTC